MQTSRTTDPIRAESARLASAEALAKVREARKARAGNGVRTYARRWVYDPTLNARPVSRKERAALAKRRVEYWI